MTSNLFDEAMRRDDDLIAGLCQAARTTRMELREWAQAELKATLIEAELQELQSSGLIQEQIRGAVERLRVIDKTDIPEAIRMFDDVITDVSQGGSEDVCDAYDRLRNGCAGLVQIARELLKIRSFIGEQGDN